MYNYNRNKNYDTLSNLIEMEIITPEKLLDLFINWHGLESLTDEFMVYVIEEME